MVRVKQRYLLGELHVEGDYKNLSQKEVQEALRDAVKDSYGDLGLAML